MIERLLRNLAVSNIYLYDFVRTRVASMQFMLPHDRDFYGLASFGDGERIFLDIGANDGISARSYRKLVKNRPIVSIEANSFHMPALKKVKNSILGFDYHLMGASDAEGLLTLNTPIYKGIPLTNYASLSQSAARKNLKEHMRISNISEMVKFEAIEVKVAPVDTLNLDPAVVKIDVEGFEDGVIRGMLQTIKRSLPVIMLEYNTRSYAEVSVILQNLGYVAKVYNPESNAFSNFEGDGVALNVFFLPESFR
jgi:FkbM family methyltransferase